MTAQSAILIPAWSHVKEPLCITACCRHCWFCMICINAQKLFLPLFQHTRVTRFSSVPILYAVW